MWEMQVFSEKGTIVRMQNMHHATVFVGRQDLALAQAQVLASEVLGMPSGDNIDYTEIIVPSFGIEESRELKERAAQTPTKKNQVFVVAAHTYTVPAQNALLKVLEEPALGTFLILISPTVEQLLPTVRSRLQVRMVAVNTDVHEDISEGVAFLGLPVSERLRYIERYHKPEKDRVGTALFLDQIEHALHRKLQGETQKAQIAGKLRTMMTVRSYLTLPSSSPKLILEHIALTL
jgi:DNA polymerase III delta prime subunit